jgi:DNA-binding transcriptional regulator YiaG
VWYS